MLAANSRTCGEASHGPPRRENGGRSPDLDASINEDMVQIIGILVIHPCNLKSYLTIADESRMSKSMFVAVVTTPNVRPSRDWNS